MSNPSQRANTVRSYFERLTASDIPGILELFADDGFVVSPVLGTMPADAFFATLNDASEQNVLTVHRVLSSDDNQFHAAHFTYE